LRTGASLKSAPREALSLAGRCAGSGGGGGGHCKDIQPGPYPHRWEDDNDAALRNAPPTSTPRAWSSTPLRCRSPTFSILRARSAMR